MLTFDFRERISAEDALKSPFFDEIWDKLDQYDNI